MAHCQMRSDTTHNIYGLRAAALDAALAFDSALNDKPIDLDAIERFGTLISAYTKSSADQPDGSGVKDPLSLSVLDHAIGESLGVELSTLDQLSREIKKYIERLSKHGLDHDNRMTEGRNFCIAVHKALMSDYSPIDSKQTTRGRQNITTWF